jgi:3,4-dihydroxy 2-butanone 4-phosphate synthase/GTP cyclohydrolase II
MQYEKPGSVERDWSSAISPTEEIINEARNGRMFILVDHEDRENEGDLVIPAQMATPDAVNFMATHGRGLICLSMPGTRIDTLGLPLMSSKNSSRHETAFTMSIEASEGVTTGISAHDRALTIAVAIDPTKGAADLATPGHVFPLRARDGGVLVRAGHTEAAVDISRLAGLNPAGVICEIMNEDGTMARLPDLVAFAQKHGLKIGTISDLIAYRRRHDNLIAERGQRAVDSVYGGEWMMRIFADETTGAEHIVLIKGDLAGAIWRRPARSWCACMCWIRCMTCWASAGRPPARWEPLWRPSPMRAGVSWCCFAISSRACHDRTRCRRMCCANTGLARRSCRPWACPSWCS